MDSRKKKILHAVIKDYVDTAEPVGSRTLAKKYDLGVSPATIRNEMSDLEDLGYIRQPHTSAGRVPSDKGYKYYVDCLMEPQEGQIKPEERQMISTAFQNQAAEINTLLQESCKLLSKMTNYTAMVIKPRQVVGNLVSLNLVKVDSAHAVVVMTDSFNKVRHQIISIPEEITDEQLHEMEKLLREKLVGVSLAEVTSSLMKEVAMQMLYHQQMLQNSMALLQDLIVGSGEKTGNVFVNGALNLLNQPEFRDIDKVKELLSALEVDDVVRQLLGGRHGAAPWGGGNMFGGHAGTNVYIGEDLSATGMDACSVVTTPYYINGEMAGSIGVLGPTRMQYPKVISLVEDISKQITGKMEKDSRDNSEDSSEGNL
ncbi:MAG: heat-inducible transcriptional repressor HrcA [Bacillota bacterium]|jgi:heat-inducible transcriptional repressor